MRAIHWMQAVALLSAIVASPAIAQDCPISYGLADNSKPNKLYVYYPTADDATYPSFGFGGLVTSPAHRFDVAELTGFTGTTAELRAAITEVVRVTYCEFNVQVIETTTAPPATFARRNTVAIGTDAAGACGSETWGLAQAVDVGDATAVDFSKVWAGSYNCATGAGGALNGTNSTTLRWARSIGGTASHEAGHNFGIAHADGLVLAAGEDPLVHHIMAAGANFSYNDRAGYRRHFSNNELSILANNVGLSIQTMWNWDFINPNAETAYRLRMTFLSTKPSIVLSWSYTGSLSPWTSPVVTGPIGTQVFRGTTYNQYQIEWSTGQTWSGGTPGQVPGGASFHVGATFSSVNFTDPDAIIITAAELLDNAGAALALRPRLPGFDSGTPDAADGTLNLRFFNFAARPLIIRNVVVRELPRVMSLEAMVRNGRIIDVRGERFDPWPASTRTAVKEANVRARGNLKVPLARLDQKPRVRKVVTEKDCEAQDRVSGRDVARCNPGVSTDMFPATTVYVTATIVDPKARYWDRKIGRYVEGPLETHLYYQIAGRRRGEHKRTNQ